MSIDSAFAEVVEVDDYYIFAEVYASEWEGKPRCLTAALHYAAKGWRVFPAPRGEKRSHKSAEHSDGRKWGATSDADEIKRDFARWPEANVGIPTGAENSFWVLEADTREGHHHLEADGVASLRTLEEQHGMLPETLMAESPSGSLHLYFKWPAGITIRNTASRVAPGIDTRGEGGMVIAPPSVRHGSSRGAYTWTSNVEPAEAPSWLIDLVVAASGGDYRNDTSCDGGFDWNGRHATSSELEAEILLVEAAVNIIPNDDLDWESWNTRGMAMFVATGGTDAGFAIFDRFSRKSKKKYNAANTRDKWASYHASPPRRIGMGSIVHWANEVQPGWREAFYDQFEADFTAAAGDESIHLEALAEIAAAEAAAAAPSGSDNAIEVGIVLEQISSKEEKLNEAPKKETNDAPRNEPPAEPSKSQQRSGNGAGPPGSEARSERGASGGAQARSGDQRKTVKTFPTIDIYGWDGMPVPEQEWTVQDRIPAGHTTLFSGEGAAGKSLIELQRAAAHALGLSWFGAAPREGPALFIDAEDDEKVIHKRLHDILHYHNRKFAELRDKLYVSSLTGRDAVLGSVNRMIGKVEPTPLYGLLREIVGDIKPVSITIAAAANVFAGSEIDRN